MTSAAIDALHRALTAAQNDLTDAHAQWDDDIENGRIAQLHVDAAQGVVSELESAIARLTEAEELPGPLLPEDTPTTMRGGMGVGPAVELGPMDQERMLSGVTITKRRG